ncbi:MAG: amino acid adenylation domain-containing protein [Thermoanaerobaculia bacterium]|nr:amino acid adenylation domain-containing protein [Thermoanaerobaculia bacterium]
MDVERLRDHLVETLQALAAGARDLAELPAAPSRDHEQLAAWNATSVDYGAAKETLVSLFEAQVDRTPEAAAVVMDGGSSLTYAQLDARANQLAHRLRALGVGPEVKVGIAAERSLDLVVGLYGILKAGGAYVPIDPSYPEDRIAYMIGDAAVPVLLTQSHLSLPEHGARVVTLDDPALADEPATRPERLATADHLAYTIYTSGSTGRPKGAMNSHRGIVNRLLWMQAEYGLDATDKVLQKTPFSFDVSVWEFFWPLLVGAQLVVAKPEGHKDPAYLVATLQRHGVTTLHFVPSMLQVFVEAEGVEACTSLRRVMASGEALPVDLVRRYYQKLAAPLHNLYGPTEAAVDVTYWPTSAADPAIPIGYPVANTRIHVLDAQGRPAPIGVPGELLIGGIQVGRGYHGRPALTAEKFVPDPFSTEPGARLYRTGDLARWTSPPGPLSPPPSNPPPGEGGQEGRTGHLEYLGRIDFQVKVRGFRIELGEIESALTSQPGVREAVVTAPELAPGDRRLVAYLVAAEGATVPTPDELRVSLGARLPEYMVPSYFVTLDAMPLNPSGKVDRKLLPLPERAVSAAGEGEPPATPTEIAVAEVWCAVLGVEQVARGDHFFNLGGHSLLATRVAGRLRAAVGVDVPLPKLFEFPRLADLASWIDRRRGSAEAAASDIPLLPRASAGPSSFVTSFAQERLWFLDKFEPGSAVYNIPNATRLAGPLNLEALSQALADLVARQESLRTTFAENPEGGAPLQVIAAEGHVPLTVVDLRQHPERDREAAELAGREALEPFDLATGPLCRVTAVRLTDDETALFVTIHHIVSDGWSMDVFVRELGQAYGARATAGQPAAWPPLPLGYADYSAWQRSFLADDELERQLGFWRQALEGAPTLLEIPADRPRPAVQSFRGAVAPFRLPDALAAALRGQAKASQATVFQLLLAAFGAFLGRLTGQDDLTVGSPVSGRERPGLESLIGFFVNTLVLRQRLNGAPSFGELVTRARDGALAALAHQDVPFEKLVEELAPVRSLASTPLFQTMLVFQNPQDAEAALAEGNGGGGGLELRSQEQEIRISKFDLTLFVLDHGTVFNGHWAYRTDLFDAVTVERYARAFETFLAGALANPELSYGRLPLLPEAERRQILVEWNQPRLDYPSDGFVHELFAAQAAAAPDRVAVVFEGETLSYGELDRRANHLAQELQLRGIGPDSVVGVLAERSFELIVALFGVLKAGGAYLPLDPDLPSERLGFMIEDSQVEVVLAQDRHADGIVGYGQAQIVILDGPLPDGPAATPVVALHPENAAYVIYTSGSTGRPKGVVVSHGAMANRLRFAVANDVGPDHAFLQKTTISFDVSVLEIFAPLLAGGRTVLAKPRGQSDLAYLVELIEGQRVTHTSFPPTLLYALFEQDGFAHLGTLESVVTGGETVPSELPELFVQHSQAQLFNRYGPTEATISVTSWSCRPEVPERVLPIGFPTAKARVYVLDRELQPVPIGVPGEIYLGGQCVARGYLARPAKTAETFVPDPFSGVAGDRLYKTGDLARFRPDGALEFVGRIDNQVKIRGFRVELGEIENVLSRHAGIREVAVVDWGEGAGKTLAAYLVAGGSRRPGDNELKDLLGASLPAYMVPSAYVWLDRLPLSPSGKIDRKNLPAPEAGGEQLEPPLGPTEELVVTVWQELLGTSRIGRNSNFFDLGGHSLLATRVASRVRELLDVELPLRVFFEQPTVKGLARALEVARRTGGESATEEPIERLPRPAGEVVTFPLSFGQRRLWFLDRLEPGSIAYNLPATVRMQGPLDVAILERALDALVARHESLRTTFAIAGGEPVQRIAPTGKIPLNVVDLTDLPAEERLEAATRQAETTSRSTFDLASGPLVRLEVIRLAPEDYVVQILMHHIISDGWSVGVFFKELLAFSSAFLEGREPNLPTLTVDYADFSVWQRRQLSGAELEDKLQHWRGKLAGAPALLPLPTDRPRPPVQRFVGGQHWVNITADQTARLAAFARGRGATMFMALYALYSALLARLTGADDLVVGTPIAGRRHAETEPLIGLFLNTLALRLDLAGDPSLGDILDRARTVTLDAYGYQDLPFEMIVDDLQPERSLAHSPIFQVLIVLQNTALQQEKGEGDLELKSMRVEGSTSKFDLTLNVTETADYMAAQWNYNRDLFDFATIDQMARRFSALLDAGLADPALPLSKLPMLLPAEVEQLRSWNKTAVDYDAAGATLVSLFEAQVARSPEAVAVVMAEEGDHGGPRLLTYAQLDTRANQLAHRLRALGVGPEVKVGIAAERSLDLVVGLYGILKAGGAYVPIDPSYPEDRIAYMIGDAAVPVLLTQSHLTLPEHEAQVVLLDDPSLAAEPMTRPEPWATAEHLAYTIYTSGSTGRPKGAKNAHRGIVNRLLWMQAEYELDSSDRVLQKTPFSFDVSVWEFFWPLLVGAQLVVAKPEGHKDPAYLVETIARHGITTLHFVPSMLQVFVEASGVERCTSLRRVMASGEALPADLVKRHYERLPDTPLHNLYGPTEAAVDVTYWPTSAVDRAIPIGYPVANTRIHILDARLHEVPVGVAGELLIGGIQVGRGYHGRPALTAEKFIPDPFATEPGARLYRTGDLARWVTGGGHIGPPLQDEIEHSPAGVDPAAVGADQRVRPLRGHVEYLGRIDFQVKIRGFRIELGEIESALAAQPNVREAVVTVRTVGGGPALVAYLTATVDELDTAALRAALLARLPEYMVPAHFLLLPEMPLNPSGKIDRKQLPAPEVRAGSAERVAPRTPLEAAVAALFASRLELPEIGVEDNFFALGGNSIGGALLINELQEKLGEIVHVVALFDSPTPAAMAAFLEREYPASVGRLTGAGEGRTSQRKGAVESRLTLHDGAVVRALIDSLPALPLVGAKNRPAVFVLAPPSSGAEPLRAIWAQHPGLFAAGALELLDFNHLAERRRAFDGAHAARLAGLVEALAAATGTSDTEARERLATWEAESLPVKETYARLLAALGDRLLVDDTPSYAWDLATLRRAEATFQGAKYVHLVRHPYASLHEFEQSHADDRWFTKDHPYTRRQLGELLWWLAHRNVLDFLRTVPAERHLLVRYEDLVTQPAETLARVAEFLGVDAIAEWPAALATDDAEAWQQAYDTDFLGDMTWELAVQLGYRQSAPERWLIHRVWQPGALVPLSYSQERLWFLDRLEPGSATYNLPSAIRIRGPLDTDLLAAAFQSVVDRQAALRTTFVLESEGPLQRVAERLELVVPLEDLSGLGEAEREAELQKRLLVEARRAFDLEQGPLVRASLLRLAPNEHALIMVFHHIVADGWSMGVVSEELSEIYRAALAGREPRLPELPVTYADFAVWQRQWLSGLDFERQLEFWRTTLEGAPPLLPLPTDRPRPTVQRYRGTNFVGYWSRTLTDDLQLLCRESGATFFVGLVALFDLLLARLSGSDDVVVGTPTAGRTRSEVENLVGLFLNTLALRLKVRPEKGFRSLLTDARSSILGAFGHQEVPFEQLLAALDIERSLAHTPIFQHLLVLQNAVTAELDKQDLDFGWIPLEGSVAKFDLSVAVNESKEAGLMWNWMYNVDLFDEATVQTMTRRLEALARGLLAEPERPVGSVSLLLPEEERQLLAWNQTAVDYAVAEATLVSLFEAQVDRTPEAVAVVMDEEGAVGAAPRGRPLSLTYLELDTRANQLAHRLRALGVGPEVKVGIAAERSVEMVVGLYGILKAGGAYVPIDPSYPEDRIVYMIGDAAVPVLVTQAHLSLPAHEATVVHLDDPTLGAEPATRPQVAQTADHLAYTIYTSGSTGRPKGAMNSHRGIVNRLLWMQAEYGLDATDRVLQKTPFSFDVSVWEFFWPLLVGARLVVAKPEGHKDPGYLVEAIQRHEVTTLHFVPSMLQVFVEAPGVEGCASLRRVMASGEALPADLVKRWYEQRPDTPLHNLYGPTEAAVDVTYWPTTAADRAIPIGYPVANTRIHVLDAQGLEAPVGVAGELLIGGVQVGRGYHGRPALTAERFVPDPFSVEPGARLYRTGDLARWTSPPSPLSPPPFNPRPGEGEEYPETPAAVGAVLRDRPLRGHLEYLGRIDFQVKIRGFRIELGEIEAALAAQPGVRESVVLARTDVPGAGPALVAYLVADGEAPVESDLRSALGARLPDYMVPTAFVVLDAMPLNPSGKVDRKKLPAPERLGEERRQKVAPRTPVENFLFEFWSRLLQRRDFGVLDDFFALGGNSLLGAIFINELQKRLGEIVHVVTLFDRPTIERFAEYLEREHETAVARLVGIGTGGRSRVAEGRVDEGKIATIRGLIPRRPVPAPGERKPNPRAVFVLAPPRSGTTLLRVMLGGHPQIFAPPELELLNFETLAERREAFAGPQAYRLEGAPRAVVQLTGETADEAQARLERLADDGTSVAEFYGWLQEHLDGRLLVDKTPTYAWDPGTLESAEVMFDEPLYIHLVRHPYGMIRSFEEARIDQVFWRTEQPYGRRELAEILWTVAHQNIAKFFEQVPAERRLEVHFERLVREPEAELERLSQFLGIDYVPAMANPYEDKKARMTDGLRAESRMIGDVKFHGFQGVDAKTADQWRTAYDHDFLGEPTWAVAESLGIGHERIEAPALPPALVPLAPGEAGQPPLYLVHPVSGDVFFYRFLARELGGVVPLFGFEAPGRERPAERLESLAELAAHYVASLLTFQKEGPYLLAGSSMGGAIAFEMARQLEAAGRAVAFVGMFDVVHPTELAAADLGEGVRSELALLRFLTGGAGEDVTEDTLLALEPAVRLELLLGRIRAAGAPLPSNFGTRELGALLDLIKTNQRSLATYVPGAYGGPVTFFRAETPLAHQTRPTEDAWRPSIRGELAVIVTPGNHLGMNFPPHVAQLAARLREVLAKVLEGVTA